MTNSTDIKVVPGQMPDDTINVISHTGGVPTRPDEKPKAGGVFTFLVALFNYAKLQGRFRSFYLDSKTFGLNAQTHNGTNTLHTFDEQTFRNHYTAVNEFLWFALHGLFSKVKFERFRWRQAVVMSKQFVHYIVTEANKGNGRTRYFVNDYQWILAPRFIRELDPNAHIAFFLHIPFMPDIPANRKEELESMIFAVHHLLAANCIGVHRAEYRANLFGFITKHMSSKYVVDWARGCVVSKEDACVTHVVVAPLGIDYIHWANTAPDAKLPVLNDNVDLENNPFFITVGRADPIKGLLELLFAIRRFFDKYGDDGEHGRGWIGRITFVIAGGQSRKGIPEYDKYLDVCLALHNEINGSLTRPNWSAVNWLTESFSHDQLGAFFHWAVGCIIGSVADGLNLVAKEYLARNRGKGLLLLSRQTGAFPQLEKFALLIDPHNVEQMADQFLAALLMDEAEKVRRSEDARAQLEDDTVEAWWRKFSSESGLEQSEETEVA